MLVLPSVFAKDVMALFYIMESIGIETTKIPGKHFGAALVELCALKSVGLKVAQ